MNELNLIEAVEKYLRGEMSADEKKYFESLRRTNPEVDQLVVEYSLLFSQVNQFGELKNFKAGLRDAHANLQNDHTIHPARPTGKARIIYLWNRYKRVASIAAMIAGLTTITVVAILWSISPKIDNQKMIDLNRKLRDVENGLRVNSQQVNNLTKQTAISKSPVPFKSGGTGFLIDGKGYLVTNAHIIRNSKHIAVINNKNEEYNAVVLATDAARDLAVLKIDDSDFKALGSIPYGISKIMNDVAEPVYTLGFPRNDIVYSEGYLSARTGFNGDTLSCQLGIAANRGNSGGPVFNSNGEVIGILSNKETEAEGVAFAIRAKYIYGIIDEMKKDNPDLAIHLSTGSSVSGKSRQQQVKKIQDFVFMVKGD